MGTPQTAAKAVHRALTTLEAALATEPLDDATLAATLAILDRSGTGHPQGAQQRLTGIVGDLRATLGARLPFKETVVFAGVGVLERAMTSRRYVWDDGRRLAHIVAARAADEATVDPETGEIVPVPPGAVAARVCDELIACAGLDNQSASWRSSELEKRGVVVADHRSVANEGRLGTRWRD